MNIQNRVGSSHRLPVLLLRARLSHVVLAMLATMASVYVAGRLWQDSQTRVYLIQQLDRTTNQRESALSVYDTLQVVDCRDQLRRLAALEMKLAAARQKGFVGSYSSESIVNNNTKRKTVAVIGVITGFARKSNRDAIRKSWFPTGATLKKFEDEKGIVVRFVIGRSANRGDSMDKAVDDENKHTNDFMVLNKHIEASEETPKKTKRFFVHAATTWDAEFYARVNDDVYVNIDTFGAMLATYGDKPRVYLGCMKSGVTDGMSRTGGSLGMENRISGMLLVSFLSSPELWHSLSASTKPFSEHMPMMMSLLDRGSLALM